MLDVQVIAHPAAAAAALEPMRSQLLAELAEPASAAALAERVGGTRQQVNYHLRKLEEHGLVALAEKRSWGGLIERVMTATAASYVVSPEALGPVAADPARGGDPCAPSYLVALAGRAIRELGRLLNQRQETGKRFATTSVDAEIRFRSTTHQGEFAGELTKAVNKLLVKYHDPSAPGGQRHRLVVLAHPLVGETVGEGRAARAEKQPKKTR